MMMDNKTQKRDEVKEKTASLWARCSGKTQKFCIAVVRRRIFREGNLSNVPWKWCRITERWDRWAPYRDFGRSDGYDGGLVSVQEYWFC